MEVAEGIKLPVKFTLRKAALALNAEKEKAEQRARAERFIETGEIRPPAALDFAAGSNPASDDMGGGGDEVVSGASNTEYAGDGDGLLAKGPATEGEVGIPGMLQGGAA